MSGGWNVNGWPVRLDPFAPKGEVRFERDGRVLACITNIGEGAGITPAFIEELTKRSVEADEIGIECGRLRLQRAVQAAVEMFVEQQNLSAGRTAGGK